MKRNTILITTIILLVMTITSICCFTAFSAAAKNTSKSATTISEVNIPSETSKDEAIKLDVIKVKRVKPANYNEAKKSLTKATTRKKDAKSVYDGLVKMGYKKTHPAVELAITEYNNAKSDVSYYKKYRDAYAEKVKWDERAKEYPAATQIWRYLKNLGYSDAVCAGIMGNLMAEVGGQTLNIRYTLYSSDGQYYGMCQWSKKYFGKIHGAGLTAQCDFLRDTIKSEINTYGYKYASGMNYANFLKLNSPSKAALCFAKAYERCGSGSYSVRQSNAEKAYKYFTS